MKKAFTLIELLVVISIIALLISILLPVLSNARSAAQGVKCLANQKQIGFAWAVYANDYDDYLPRWWDFDNSLTWSENLVFKARLLPATSDIFFCPIIAPQTYDGASQISSRPLAFGYGTPQYWRDSTAEFMSGYADNDFMKLSAIDQPSRTFFTADSFDQPNGIQRYDLNNNHTQKAVHLRHGEGANASKADGSAGNQDADYFRGAYNLVWILFPDGSITK